MVSTGWATFSQMKALLHYSWTCQEEFMRELHESQHMQVVSSIRRAGSDAEQTVESGGAPASTTAHAMHLLPPQLPTSAALGMQCRLCMLSNLS